MSVGTACPQLSGLSFLKGDPLPIGAGATGGKRRVFVLEFWATWCPPCRQSIPHLSELQRKHKDKDVYIVGITKETDVTKLQRFIQQNGMDYTVVADLAGTADAQLYMKSEAGGIPHAFIVDVNNQITYSGHPMDPQFERLLAAAAAQASDRQAAQVALPLVSETYEQLMQRSVKELRGMLAERGVSCSDCIEKGDLARRIVERCSSTTYYARAPAGAA